MDITMLGSIIRDDRMTKLLIAAHAGKELENYRWADTAELAAESGYEELARCLLAEGEEASSCGLTNVRKTTVGRTYKDDEDDNGHDSI